MKRPNLVNPGLWTPFKPVPIPEPIYAPLPPPLPMEVEIPRPITRKEMIQRNSFWLNFLGMLILFAVGYFLYSIYLERKIFAEYLSFVRNQEDNYPGFF